MDESEDERRDRVERLNARKRYNMKALGRRLVDENRHTGTARSTPSRTGPRSVTARETAEDPSELDVDPADASVAGGGAAPLDVTAPTDQGATNGAGYADDDQVDRSGMGGTVTRSGLSDRLDTPAGPAPLARRMLDTETGPGGRISDPRDVAGIVLDLAKDLPAAVAVSVVRIDEQVEIVGDSIDESIDPSIFSVAFSNVFQNVRPAAEALEKGPLGTIQDVVIEGEHMDLVLRPLGASYYLMVLEDRHDPAANLAVTRMLMATIAPAMKAILAQQDSEA